MRSIVKILSKGLLVIAIAMAVNGVADQPAHAVTAADWRAGNIIEDIVFYNKNAMNVEQIQAFLNSKVPNCDNWGTQAYAGTTRRAYSEARGIRFPLTCIKDYYENPTSHENNLEGRPVPAGGKSAAQIIWEAGQDYGINPEVLLVLLQKEQALVQDDWPWPIQYQGATGYGCPDSAPCDAEYYGLYNQVRNAARQFRRYANFPNDYNFVPGRANFIGYNPNGACGGGNVYIENQATASLYNYTPYQPNASALNNLYGSGDACGAYGNRNFWRIFNDWFGPTRGDGFILARSDNPNDLSQWVVYRNVKQHIQNAETIYAWNLQDQPLITVSQATLDAQTTIQPLDRLMRLYGNPGVYLVDNGRRYHMGSAAMFDSWNLDPTNISDVSPALFHLTYGNYNLTYSVKDPNSSNIYALDGRGGNGKTVLRKYQNDTVRRAWEGDTAGYVSIGSDYWDRLNDSFGADLTNTKISYGGHFYEVANGTRMQHSSTAATFYPGTAQAVSKATVDRLPANGSATHLVRSVSSPAVYLVDGGVKHYISSPDVLWAWRPNNGQAQISDVNDNFLSLIPTSDPLTSYIGKAGSNVYIMNSQKVPVTTTAATAYQNTGNVFTASANLFVEFDTASFQAGSLLRGNNTPQVYAVDNSGKKRHLSSPNIALAWGSEQDPGVAVVAKAVVDSLQTAAVASMYVSDGTTNYVLENGKKLSVSGSVATDWGLSSPQTYNDGTLNRFASGGSLANNVQAGGGYFIVRGGMSYGTIDPWIAAAWGISNAPLRSTTTLDLVRNGMLARYVRSTTPGDNRVFMVDNGQWYNLGTATQQNLNVADKPTMWLNPSAGGAITDWNGAIVKNAGGSYFVVDDGQRDYFEQDSVRNRWTNNGSLSVPTVTNEFIWSLPPRSPLQKSVKGSAGAIYSVENGAKRHILYPATYESGYAPFNGVSDKLLNVLSTGTPIQ